MEVDSIQEKVRQVLAGIFSFEPSDIGLDSSIKTIEQWDSLQHVNLMMAIEQEFDIRIDVEDAVEMTSFAVVCEKLARYLGGA